MRPSRRIGTLGCYIVPVPFLSPPPPLPYALSVCHPLGLSASSFHPSSSPLVTPSPPPPLQLCARPTALRQADDRHRRRRRSQRRAVRLWLPRPAACPRRREPVPQPAGGGQWQRVANRPLAGTTAAAAAAVAVTPCRGRPRLTRPRQRPRRPHGAAHRRSRHRHASLIRKAARPPPPRVRCHPRARVKKKTHRLSGRRFPVVRSVYRPLPSFQEGGRRQTAFAPPRRWAHADRPARRQCDARQPVPRGTEKGMELPMASDGDGRRPRADALSLGRQLFVVPLQPRRVSSTGHDGEVSQS